MSEFVKSKKHKDGLNSECKICSRERTKKSYYKHHEKRKLKSKLYMNEHKDERNEYRKIREKRIVTEADYIDKKEKKCYYCKEVKLINLFGVRKAAIDGHDNICKPCEKIRSRKNYFANREKRIQQSIDYQKKNPWPSRLSKKKFRAKADLSGWDLTKWSNAVKNRDDNKCVECSSYENLEAHHIREKAVHPELALKLWNGITLCQSCHGRIHHE